ncbi:hypothetical protein Lser_V15G31655 [Lactuca serriola]
MSDPRLIEKGDGEAAMFEAYCSGNWVAQRADDNPSGRKLLAHPGGPMKTNKVVAVAKFLERKSQEPSGLSSINSKLVELAVKNAKETVRACNASNSERRIQHINSFSDDKDMIEEDQEMEAKPIKLKKKKNKKKKKKNRSH